MSMLPIFLGNSLEYDPCECGRNDPSFYQKSHSHPWYSFGFDITPAEVQLSAKNNDVATKRYERKIKPFINENGFQYHMNVQEFKPSEINIKTVNDFVVIEGKHESREDEYGNLSRHFIRKYKLPKGYDANLVISTLSSDGVLTVKAPPPAKSIENKERVVQIQQTGPAHLHVKINKSEDSLDPKSI